MLARLKEMHADLRAAIAALKAEVARAARDDEGLSTARLRLSRLSRQRRLLIETEIYPKLGALSPQEAQRIAHLRTDAGVILTRSSAHIGRWTMRAINADWAGYPQAANAMLGSMLRRIDDEGRALYPLLERAEAADQASSET